MPALEASAQDYEIASRVLAVRTGQLADLPGVIAVHVQRVGRDGRLGPAGRPRGQVLTDRRSAFQHLAVFADHDGVGRIHRRQRRGVLVVQSIGILRAKRVDLPDCGPERDSGGLDPLGAAEGGREERERDDDGQAEAPAGAGQHGDLRYWGAWGIGPILPPNPGVR
jgi:hypothetical protein